MLCVTCATLPSESLEVHSGSPTRMTTPLPSWVALSAGRISRGSLPEETAAASSSGVSGCPTDARFALPVTSEASSSTLKPGRSFAPSISPYCGLALELRQRRGRRQRARLADPRAERVGGRRLRRARERPRLAVGVDAQAHAAAASSRRRTCATRPPAVT